MTSPYDENWNLDAAPRPTNERSLAGDATHQWRNDLGSWVTCGACGIVRRADRMHRPCAGHPPTISTRAHRCNGGRSDPDPWELP